MSIYENLRKIRQSRGMSQADLADAVGVQQQLISQLENGKNTSTKKLPEIARALGCAIHEIDPNYFDVSSGDQSEVREKFNVIVAENDEDRLRLLDAYLDFLLSTKKPPERNTP